MLGLSLELRQRLVMESYFAVHDEPNRLFALPQEVRTRAVFATLFAPVKFLTPVAVKNAQFRLLDLPFELRESIYEFALARAEPIVLPVPGLPWDKVVPTYFYPSTLDDRITKQLKIEMLPMFFKSNVFNLVDAIPDRRSGKFHDLSAWRRRFMPASVDTSPRWFRKVLIADDASVYGRHCRITQSGIEQMASILTLLQSFPFVTHLTLCFDAFLSCSENTVRTIVMSDRLRLAHCPILAYTPLLPGLPLETFKEVLNAINVNRILTLKNLVVVRLEVRSVTAPEFLAELVKTASAYVGSRHGPLYKKLAEALVKRFMNGFGDRGQKVKVELVWV